MHVSRGIDLISQDDKAESSVIRSALDKNAPASGLQGESGVTVST